MSNQTKPTPPVVADNPIQHPGEDVLGRAEPARSFAKHVLSLDAAKGATVGLFGPWGSGKTSFLNLARSEFEARKVIVLDFNPWLFSNTEHLVGRFFDELSDHLPVNDGKDKLNKTVKKYGAAITGASGLFGIPFLKEGISALLGAVQSATDQSESVTQLRDQITKALDERKEKIVVILDDVDRLSPSEIQDIFKLVRLTASFPKLIYIVACDRHQIEEALEREVYSGRNYLEKIIQFPYNLPEIPPQKLQKWIKDEVDKILSSVENADLLNQNRWGFVRRSIVCPLIGTMRDVRRYASAVWQAVVDLNGQVELTDVLGLEAVRLFLPDTFNRLPDAMDVLTRPSPAESVERSKDRFGKVAASGKAVDMSGDSWSQAKVERVKELIEAEQMEKRDIVIAMILLLFRRAPGDTYDYLGEMLALMRTIPEDPNPEHCVTNQSIFRFYLERVANEGTLALSEAMRALEHMNDREGFDSFMRGIDQRGLLHVIQKLDDLKGRFQSDHAEPGITVLLNLLADLSRQIKGNALDGYCRSIGAVVAGLLGTQTSTDDAHALVSKVCSKVALLSSKLVLLEELADDAIDRKVFSEAVIQKCKKCLRDGIEAASVDELAGEWRLGRIFKFVIDEDIQESLFSRIRTKNSPKMTFAILRTNIRREDFDQNKVLEIDWRRVKSIYGEDALIKDRVERLKSASANLESWIEALPIKLGQARNLLEKAVSDLENGKLSEQVDAES